MKRIIAIAMAIVMMMAIAVPAFAAGVNPITNETADQYGTADVYTKTTNADGEEVWFYTVEIPADLEISWGDKEAKNMTYKVESQLLIGATLTVSVAGSGEMSATGTTEKLAYTLTGGDAVEFSAVNAANTTGVNADGTGIVDGENVKVQITTFDGKPVGAYRDTLTFTVEYEAPTPVTP